MKTKICKGCLGRNGCMCALKPKCKHNWLFSLGGQISRATSKGIETENVPPRVRGLECLKCGIIKKKL